MSVQEKINGLLAKLPFRNLAENHIPAAVRESFPLLNSVIPFANHIACGLALVLVVAVVTSSGGQSGSSDSRSSGSKKLAQNVPSTVTPSGSRSTAQNNPNDISQAIINGTTFVIGKNKYSNDHNLIYNNWFKGHLTADELKPGDDFSWVNDFTKRATLKEPSLARIRYFDIDLGEFKVLEIETRYKNIMAGVFILRLFYEKNTDILKGIWLTTDHPFVYASIDLPSVSDIYSLVDYLKVPQPQSISLGTAYDLSDSKHNIVNYYEIGADRISPNIYAYVFIRSIQVSPENFLKIKEIKDFHEKLGRELPREYRFIYEEL